MAQAVGELSSAPLELFCASLEPAKAIELLSGDQMENLVVFPSSLAATKDEDEEYLCSEVRETVHVSDDLKGVLLSSHY